MDIRLPRLHVVNSRQERRFFRVLYEIFDQMKSFDFLSNLRSMKESAGCTSCDSSSAEMSLIEYTRINNLPPKASGLVPTRSLYADEAFYHQHKNVRKMLTQTSIVSKVKNA